MDFSFTSEQQMLLDSTRRFLADHYGLDQRRRIITSSAGYSAAVWRQFAELGLLALNIPEGAGGLGGGPVETLLVSQALGEAIVVEPFLSSAVLATRAITTLGSESQQAEWLPQLASGELILAFAHEEPDSSALQTSAQAANGDWVLNGRKAVVYHAPLAGMILVAARVERGATGAGGGTGEVGLFAVAPDQSGVRLEAYTTVDGQRAADVVLDNVKVAAGARIGGDARAALPAVLDFGLAALCAEAVGALDKLLAMTVEYSRTRVQFGVPIGRFQALQHRMADMLTHVEQARSMAYLAASRCTSADPAERTAALSAAKVTIGQAARFVGQQAVQLHGGMGVTDEFGVSHYFKRLLAFELRFGSTDAHLERYGQYL